MDNQDSSATDDTVLRKTASARSSERDKSDAAPAGAADDLSETVTRQVDQGDLGAEDEDGFSPGLEEAKTVIRQVQESGKSRPERSGRTPADIAKVLVGEQLNQYFLEALVGGGGMGAVFRAHDQQLDRIVALKVIPFVGNDPELQRRFRNEAQNAAKLDHPRIARIFDAGSYDDWHYIVFEYIKGTNVRDLVDDHGVLSLDDAVVFTSQVAEALDHASQRGIVHRDIKPSNVLVSEDGSVKLVDMGLARSDNLDLSEDMTASGVTLGTFDYISPEQAFDPRDADLRSDLYSLGCTFYFMVTGEAPYTGGTMLQKLISHGNAPLPNPQQLRPDLPDEAKAVMHRMMAKEPDARYQNARDLLADLSELAYRFQLKRAQSNAVVTLPTSNDGLHRLQTHLPWMIAVLLILMVGGYLELQSTASRDVFVIGGPASVSRTGQQRNLPNASLPIGAAVDPVSDVQRNSNGAGFSSESSVDGFPRNDGSVDPSGADSTSSSAVPSDLMTEESGNVDSSASGDALSEAAAKPPRIVGRLPDPEMLDAITNDRSGTGESIGGLESTGDLESGIGAGTASAPVDGVDDVPSDEVVSMTQSPKDSPTRPRLAARLPSPDCVRIVAPSLLALAIRVDQVDRDTDGAILVATLEDAIDLAMRFGVERVELATPVVVSGPIAIPQDNMVFESTVTRTTVRMVSSDTLAIGRSDMINIGNNRTLFRNLDFQWELAQEQVDGGSMFVINDNRSTRFQDCTFTLVNKAIHDGVTFFRIVTDPNELPDSETLPGRVLNPNANALPLVAIQLDNAIVRGEGTFIEMDYAAALQLVWNNGLLAISGRMIETSGALRRPTLVSGPIELSMSDVTAEIPRGLLRMRLGPTGIFPVSIERQANRCVFLVDEGQPLVELRGVESLSVESPYLKLRGSDNAYVGAPTLTDPLLFVSDLEGNASVNIMEELPSGALPWVDEQSPHWSVRWSMVRPRSQTYHLLTPANYRQDGVIRLGFKESDLPSLP